MPSLLTRIMSPGFLKYLVSGAGAFVVEYGSFYALYTNLHSELYVANSVSFVLGLSTSFLLNRLWTFNNDTYQKKSAHQLSYYVVLALINLLLTNVLVGVLQHFGLVPRIGKLVAMIVTSLWNYFLFKVIIFNHQKPVKIPVD